MSKLQQVFHEEMEKIAREEARKIVSTRLTQAVEQRLDKIEERLRLTEKTLLQSEEHTVTGTDFTAFRILHSLTQRDFARLLGTNPTSVCRWETGKVHPGPGTVTRFSALQELSRNDIEIMLDRLRQPE
jgi:Predicted transcriptional regulator